MKFLMLVRKALGKLRVILDKAHDLGIIESRKNAPDVIFAKTLKGE